VLSPMAFSMRRALLVLTMAAVALAAGAPDAYAKHKPPKPAHVVTDAGIAEVQRAIDEQRYVDAGQALDQALFAGLSDPRLFVLSGELSLAKGRYADALTSFKRAETDHAMKGRALQGQGIAL